MLIYTSFFIIFTSVVVLTAINKKNLAYLYAFFLPFFGIIYEVGLQVNPEKLVSMYMLVFMLMFPKKFFYNKENLSYIGFAILSTTLLSFSLPEYADEFPILRGKLRWVFQIIYMILSFAPLHYIPCVLKTYSDIKKITLFFIFSCLINAIMGITQYATYKLTGVDIFPMSLFMGTELRDTALYDWGNLRIMRVCGLGGEPKNLAYTMVTGFVVLYSFILSGGRYKMSWSIIAILIICICLFLTLSSQGIILLGFALIFCPIIMMIVKRKATIRGLFATIFVVMAGWYIWNFTVAGKLLQLRTVERFTEKGVGTGAKGIEDFDEIILSYLNDNPFRIITGFGLGNVHFYTREYIPKDLKYYIDKSVFVSKKGMIKIITETGVIGLFIFFRGLVLPLRKFSKFGKITLKEINKNATIVAFVFICLNFFIACDGPFYLVLVLSVILAINKIVSNNLNKPLSKCAV